MFFFSQNYHVNNGLLLSCCWILCEVSAVSVSLTKNFPAIYHHLSVLILRLLEVSINPNFSECRKSHLKKVSMSNIFANANKVYSGNNKFIYILTSKFDIKLSEPLLISSSPIEKKTFFLNANLPYFWDILNSWHFHVHIEPNKA